MSMRKHTSATYKSVKHKKKLMCQAGTYSPHSNGQTQKVIKEKFLNFQFLVDSLQDPEFAILAILNNKLWFIQYTIVVEASHNQVSFIKNILILSLLFFSNNVHEDQITTLSIQKTKYLVIYEVSEKKRGWNIKGDGGLMFLQVMVILGQLVNG